MHSTNCLLSVFFVCMGVRYTHFPFSETSFSSPTLPCSSTVYHNDMCYVSPASSVTAVCSMPQYFKQELYFKQLTGFYFLRTQKKRDRSWLQLQWNKHSQQHRIRSHCTFMHVRQLLTASCGIIAWQCIIYYRVGAYYSVGFPPGKELVFLQKCNQLSSEICDFLGLYTACNHNSYHHCLAWPLNMGPEGCPETSVAN